MNPITQVSSNQVRGSISIFVVAQACCFHCGRIEQSDSIAYKPEVFSAGLNARSAMRPLLGSGWSDPYEPNQYFCPACLDNDENKGDAP